MAADFLTRRGLLDLAIRAAALPAGAQFFAAWSKAAQNHQHSGGSSVPADSHLLQNYKPAFFSPEDFEALQALTEILIPSDDTPGAREACCAQFIDFVLHAQETDDYAPETRQHWRVAMTALRAAGFHSADPKGREAVVAAISLPERDRAAKHPAYFAYQLIKRENTFAFYTARAGMIEDLDYKGNSFNATFPACNHPEHQVV
jgi:hypothetical protein